MFLGRKLAAGRDVMTFSGGKDHFNSQDNGGGMQILGIQRFPPQKTGITSGGGSISSKSMGIGLRSPVV